LCFNKEPSADESTISNAKPVQKETTKQEEKRTTRSKKEVIYLKFTRREILALLQELDLAEYKDAADQAMDTLECWFASVLDTADKTIIAAKKKEMLAWLESNENITKFTKEQITNIKTQLSENEIMANDLVTAMFALKEQTTIFVAEIDGVIRKYGVSGDENRHYQTRQQIINEWSTAKNPKCIIYNSLTLHYTGTRAISSVKVPKQISLVCV